MKTLTAHDPAAVADTLGEMEFHKLADFDSGHAGVFWSEAGGPSPWEMHPECDELLHVIAGAIRVEVLPLEGGAGVSTEVPAGSFLVVPRGCWHRQILLGRTKEYYVTPGPTLHSDAADPRQESSAVAAGG